MHRRTWAALPPILLGLLLLAPLPAAPTDEPDQRGTQPPRDGNFPPGGPPPFGPGGPPPFGPLGPGGFGGPMGQQHKLVQQFDKDGDGWLNMEERQAARAFLKKERTARGRGGFGPGGRGGFGPATFLTRPLLEALDANRDGKVT